MYKCVLHCNIKRTHGGNIFNHNSTGTTSGATLVKKTKHIRIKTVFVIGPEDTTQNSMFDEGKLPM